MWYAQVKGTLDADTATITDTLPPGAVLCKACERSIGAQQRREKERTK